MIYIQKGTEPASLTEYKKMKHAYFDGCPKDDIRESLLREQGYLCAYCMRRIDKDHMKIEHWFPQNRLSGDQAKMDYKNMLASCEGHIEGSRDKDETCDTHKKEKIIKIDPRDRSSVNQIKYKSRSGEIYADSPELEKDLNVTLNLNSARHLLKENRKEKLDSVINELHRKVNSGAWNKTKLKAFASHYAKPDAKGQKEEYLGIILWYLEKRTR